MKKDKMVVLENGMVCTAKQARVMDKFFKEMDKRDARYLKKQQKILARVKKDSARFEKWLKGEVPKISPKEREALRGLAKLIGQGLSVIRNSGVKTIATKSGPKSFLSN